MLWVIWVPTKIDKGFHIFGPWVFHKGGGAKQPNLLAIVDIEYNVVLDRM
jgi:hypothetical protein